jgi:hypothetical protein
VFPYKPPTKSQKPVVEKNTNFKKTALFGGAQNEFNINFVKKDTNSDKENN